MQGAGGQEEGAPYSGTCPKGVAKPPQKSTGFGVFLRYKNGIFILETLRLTVGR